MFLFGFSPKRKKMGTFNAKHIVYYVLKLHTCPVNCDLNHGDFKVIFYIRLIITC